MLWSKTSQVIRFPSSWKIGNLQGGDGRREEGKGIGLPRCPRHVCARKCMRLGSWAAAAKRLFITARQAFLSPWTGFDKKERVVV